MVKQFGRLCCLLLCIAQIYQATSTPIPSFLHIGYDSKHQRIRDRWGALYKVLKDQGDQPFTVVDYGSAHGGVSLSMAKTFPNARVLSIEGEYEGPPRPEHAHYANLPEAGLDRGMVDFQKLVAHRFGLSNHYTCKGMLDKETFTTLHKSKVFYDVQVTIQTFHWLRRFHPDRRHFEKAFASHIRLARTTVIDLPPTGTSFPDTGAWNDGRTDMKRVAEEALANEGVKAKVSLLDLGPGAAPNPFVLMKIELLEDGRPSSAKDKAPFKAAGKALGCEVDLQGDKRDLKRWAGVDLSDLEAMDKGGSTDLHGWGAAGEVAKPKYEREEVQLSDGRKLDKDPKAVVLEEFTDEDGTASWADPQRRAQVQLEHIRHDDKPIFVYASKRGATPIIYQYKGGSKYSPSPPVADTLDKEAATRVHMFTDGLTIALQTAVAIFDEVPGDNGGVFYYDTQTQESSWNAPHVEHWLYRGGLDFVYHPGTGASSSEGHGKGVLAGVPYFFSDGKVEYLSEDAEVFEFVHDAAGQTFFYDVKTQETSWDPPLGPHYIYTAGKGLKAVDVPHQPGITDHMHDKLKKKKKRRGGKTEL